MFIHSSDSLYLQWFIWQSDKMFQFPHSSSRVTSLLLGWVSDLYSGGERESGNYPNIKHLGASTKS